MSKPFLAPRQKTKIDKFGWGLWFAKPAVGQCFSNPNVCAHRLQIGLKCSVGFRGPGWGLESLKWQLPGDGCCHSLCGPLCSEEQSSRRSCYPQPSLKMTIFPYAGFWLMTSLQHRVAQAGDLRTVLFHLWIHSPEALPSLHQQCHCPNPSFKWVSSLPPLLPQAFLYLAIWDFSLSEIHSFQGCCNTKLFSLSSPPLSIPSSTISSSW